MTGLIACMVASVYSAIFITWYGHRAAKRGNSSVKGFTRAIMAMSSLAIAYSCGCVLYNRIKDGEQFQEDTNLLAWMLAMLMTSLGALKMELLGSSRAVIARKVAADEKVGRDEEWKHPTTKLEAAETAKQKIQDNLTQI